MRPSVGSFIPINVDNNEDGSDSKLSNVVSRISTLEPSFSQFTSLFNKALKDHKKDLSTILHLLKNQQIKEKDMQEANSSILLQSSQNASSTQENNIQGTEILAPSGHISVPFDRVNHPY